ncbi:phage minor capsid protein [Saccharothrix stipae]
MVLGVNPEQAYRSIKALTDVWEVASERMLATVARRLARGIEEPGWAERKSAEVLLVRSDLARIVQAAGADLQGQASAALEEAYGIGGTVAAQLGEVAIETNVGRVVSLVSRFVAQIRGSWLPVIRAHQDVYQRAIQDSETLMATGTMVRREAVAMAVDHLLVEGRERFTDAAGRRWHLDAYVRMAGRTAAQQAAVEGQLDGMVARGRDLVVISDSPRECQLCAPFEGKLLSVSGATPEGAEVDGHRVHGTVTEARVAGLWHPNCTHRADPFTPGFTQVPEPKENPEGYAAAQKLRRLEREVRQLKRAESALKELGETQALRSVRQKIRAKRAQIAAHADATGQNRRRERERPVGGGMSVEEARALASRPKQARARKPEGPPEPERFATIRGVELA